MKKFTIIAMMGSIIIAMSLLSSCKKDEVLKTQKNVPITLKSAPYSGCNNQCIIPGSGEYYYKDATLTIQWGGPNNNKFSKTVDLRVYNTETDFVFMFKSSQSPQNLIIDSVPVLTAPQGSEYSWHTYSIPLPSGWQACDLKEYFVEIAGSGPKAIFNVSYELIGICPGCEEHFTFQYNNDDTYTFTYTPKENFTNAFIEFTFPQSVIVETPRGWIQPGNGHVRQTHADLTACVPFTFTFKLVHTLNGQGPLWTDFKVNGVVKNQH